VTAWKIDKQRAKFIKVPGEGLLCPRSGIYAVDAGCEAGRSMGAGVAGHHG
jgi:hypothetical protein